MVLSVQVSGGKHVRPGGRRHFRRQNCFSSRAPETLSPADTDCPPLPAPGAQGAALRLHGSDSSGPRAASGRVRVRRARAYFARHSVLGARVRCSLRGDAVAFQGRISPLHVLTTFCFCIPPPPSMDTWVASSVRFCSQCCCERGCVHLFLSLHGVARSRGLSL